MTPPFRVPVFSILMSAGGILFGLLSPGVCAAEDQPRERLPFNNDWRFTRGDGPDVRGQLDYDQVRNWILPSGADLANPALPKLQRPEGNLGTEIAYTQAQFDDSGWRQLTLPHDWAIEGPFKQENPGDTGKLPWWGAGWYRKHFTSPASDRNKRVFLDLDGTMAYSMIWLNGQFVGGWPYGYSSYRVELTPFLKAGADNVLSIRLDNPPDSSRWYPGGGIYRNVWLVKTSPVHIAQWGTFVSTPVISPENATVAISVELDNQAEAAATVVVTTMIYALDAHGEKTGEAVASSSPATVKLAPGRQALTSHNIRLANPRLWNLQSPALYAAVTTVEEGPHLIDRYETVFGIRSLAFDPNRGFLLNGELVRINGVCNHHDLGALGTAVNVRALERQIEILKEMGCNAIRTSHNPPAPELLDLCDRMGMLVMDESFDCWRILKRANDYHRLFVDWHEKDLRALIRRDHNHPSVILWSIGNEIREQYEPEGWKLAAHLAAIVREEDRTRPVTAGLNSIEAGYTGFQNALDVFGYNYKPAEYGNFHQRNPTIPLLGSETASCISSRGEYFFPVTGDKLQGRTDFQVSSYDLYTPRWAFPPDNEFRGLDEFPFTGGEFVWTGFDYLGEPTPYNTDVTNLLNFSDPADQARMARELQELGKIKVPSRSSYFGIIDLAGFKKDRFYIYQARWRPDLPMAHILPHWNWPGRVGQVTPVHVYTSGDEAELFLNGQSLGRKKKGPFEYRLRWDDVVYAPGELHVVAYKKGQKWAEETMRTTGAASKLVLSADRTAIKADGKDLSYVTVTIADKDGLLVPRSKNLVKFELTGPGEIAAVDNGDATSFEPFQASQRHAYNGLALVIIRSKPGESGTITLKAVSDGLAGAETVVASGTAARPSASTLR